MSSRTKTTDSSPAKPPRWGRLREAVQRAVRIGARLDASDRAVARGEVAQLARHWERVGRMLLPLGGTSSGNDVTVFCDGDAMLEAMWGAIAAAKNLIWLEMYIIEPDKVGLRTIEELTRAAARGCRVALLYDAVGSPRLTESLLRPLREAGAEIAMFNPWLTWRRRVPLLRRDHRKITIIDGETGFTGGMNLSEDYAGKAHGNGSFHDCHMRMQGPGVRDLAAVFISSWRMATQKRLSLPPAPAAAGTSDLQVLASRGAQGRRSIQRSVRISVRNAVNRCCITTPYFVPPLRLIRAIARAAEGGADVRLLTAGKCDVPIVRLAAQHIYGRLLRRGVRIWEYQDRTLHAKTLSIDGIYATVGSFNLDQWSHKRNLEVNVGILDQRISAGIERQFMADLATSREITLDTWQRRPWWQRVIHWSAYQLLRI